MAMMNEMEYRTIGSALAGGYRAAVYCRLSKDDDLQGESASIANQRDMLEKYCEKQGWEVVAVYQDDGFTGLNMERPDLQRMLRAIERMVLGALKSTAFKYCLMLRTLVVFSLMQSKTNSIWLLFSFKNFDFTNSAG